jgi:hypothetical protein
MAESFLEEIYENAMIIQKTIECVDLFREQDWNQARAKFNEAMERLEKILPVLASENMSIANSIQDCASLIGDKWEDCSLVTGLMQGKLIPLLREFVGFYADIDVEEGTYRLKSTGSGFLTVENLEYGVSYHDVFDPLDEARRIAKKIYRPEKENVGIFGCGLGYLPYMINQISESAAKIVVYEDDATLVQYARHYGVLDWIPAENLKVIVEENKEVLSGMFVEAYDAEKNKDSVFYVAPYKSIIYKKIGIDIISKQAMVLGFSNVREHLGVINMMKNYKSSHSSFRDIRKDKSGKDWIIVAAGPSLDEKISFIKDSKDNYRIVAVNTVLRRLINEGVRPDIVVAADPRHQLVKHIEGLEEDTRELTLIADETTSWKYTRLFMGQKCFVPTPNGKGLKLSNPEGMDVWNVQGTVVDLALEAVIKLGAKKVHLIGLDLAFPKGRNYADGMPHATTDEKTGDMKVKSVNGEMIDSCKAFVMFKTIVEEKIAMHPDIDFINMSEGGAFIEGTKKG